MYAYIYIDIYIYVHLNIHIDDIHTFTLYWWVMECNSTCIFISPYIPIVSPYLPVVTKWVWVISWCVINGFQCFVSPYTLSFCTYKPIDTQTSTNQRPCDGFLKFMVPLVIIQFIDGFSIRKNTSSFFGYPHDFGNLHVCYS